MALSPLVASLVQQSRGAASAADNFLTSPGGSFLTNLLAQSGYSFTPDSPLGSIGRAALATQAQQQDREAFDLERRLIESQIGLNRAELRGGPDRDSIGALSPGQYTPESLARFARTGDYNDLEFRAPERPADLRTFDEFNQMSPEEKEDFLDVKRSTPFIDVAGRGLVQPQQTGGEPDVIVPEADIVAGTEERAAAGARGAAEGAAEGDQSSKAPILASFNVTADNVRRALENVPQGGMMGAVGYMGGFTDFQAVQDFNNAVQQLSTELRTVFRIPGEGTLSDREQEQYNLQLPNTLFGREINENILNTLTARIEARLFTPIGGEEDIDAIADQYLGD